MMGVEKRLLACALRRYGQPATVGELIERAIALVDEAGWPRDRWPRLSAKSVSKLLQGMARRGEGVVSAGRQTGIDGQGRQLWRPTNGYDPDAELPDIDAPVEANAGAELEGLTTAQKTIVFDVMQQAIELGQRQRQDIVRLLQQQDDELDRRRLAWVRQLRAAGLHDRVPEVPL